MGQQNIQIVATSRPVAFNIGLLCIGTPLLRNARTHLFGLDLG